MSQILLDDVKRYIEKENSICQILNEKNKIISSGFICKININKNPMIILLTAGCIFPDNQLKNLNTQMQIKINKTIKTIEISSNKFICTNEELYYTCIEISEQENINDYLEIEINENNKNEEYKNEKIIMLSYLYNNSSVSFSEGNIIAIKNNEQLHYSNNSGIGSTGSPLLLCSNLKVIGIHVGNHKDYRRGILIKNIVDDILLQYNKKNNNEYELNDTISFIVDNIRKELSDLENDINDFEDFDNNKLDLLKKEIQKLKNENISDLDSVKNIQEKIKNIKKTIDEYKNKQLLLLKDQLKKAKKEKKEIEKNYQGLIEIHKKKQK